jgi:large-conductance mechanosensitive channel
MREHIDRLLAQASIVTLALGVAIGWSLFQVARGVADVVQGLLTKNPGGLQFAAYQNSQPATWIVGGRVLTFTTLISGIVELAIMLLVAALIARRTALRTR